MTTVGLLGPGADATAQFVRDAGGDPVFGDDALDDADVVAALGESALLDALDANVDAPVLPVAAGREYGGVTRTALPTAVAALAEGQYETRERPTVTATAAGSEWRALADATLVTSKPAQISEFAVRADGDRVDEVRADGVVAATPAGSHGYAAAAGGPLLSPGVDALAVVPISPFRIERVEWVLAPPVELTVTREESAVSLFVDGRDSATVRCDEAVTLDWGDSLRVAVPSGAADAPTFEG